MISSLPLQTSDAAQRLELEYGWEFLADPSARMLREEAEHASGWRSARVGLSWNVQFDDLRDYMGAAWYRVSFELPAFRDTRHVLLKFGAVDYFCEVFLNGMPIGMHEGGYTPFSFEITSAVRSGANELMIRVIDPPMDEAQNRAQFPEMMYNEIPHGKQNWYVQNSGIWQGVRIETCPSLYIERLDIIPDVSGRFEIVARLAGVGLTAENGVIATETKLETEIFDTSGRSVFRSTQAVDPLAHTMHIVGTIQDPRLWEPDGPALYALTAWLSGPVQYHRRTRFGFRSFEARDGKLYLNGKAFYLIGALDQDFYPETIHSPTSEEYVRDMMTKAKRLGINLLRCHLKVAHPVYLDVADELGMLIWAELPSWSDSWFPADHFSTMAAVRADKMFWEILIRDWNHPCIVLQTIMNESWGIDLKDASQRQWLTATFDRIKALLQPLGRLVVDNSACEGNFHVKTDIEDFHQYYSMPDHVEKWDKWLAELASRPEWTFSPYGDAQRTRREPLMLSEFGNWGLPKLPKDIPWWFEMAFGERGVTRPGGVIERFHAYGFDALFGTFNEMAEETQWHQFISLKYEIEAIRSHDSLKGYVITGITDVHWEVNGLLDMWRNEKVYARELSGLQQKDLIMCNLPAHCFYGGQSIQIKTVLSHFSDADLRGAIVRWSTDWGASGEFALPASLDRGTVTHLSEIKLELPRVEGPSTEQLEIQVRLRHGHRITENSYELFVLPATKPCADVIGVPSGRLTTVRAKLKDAGYETRDNAGAAAVLITDQYDEVVAEHLNGGGRVLLLATSPDSTPPDWPIAVKLRAGTELDGRWFSNFNWVRTERPPFSAVAFGPILGFESAAVAPEYIIEGVTPEQFEDVLSGITFGWLNNNCALALQACVGSGKLIATTYRFERYGSDPYATQLLNSLLQYAAGPECQPKLRLAPVAHVSMNHVS